MSVEAILCAEQIAETLEPRSRVFANAEVAHAYFGIGEAKASLRVARRIEWVSIGDKMIASLLCRYWLGHRSSEAMQLQEAIKGRLKPATSALDDFHHYLAEAYSESGLIDQAAALAGKICNPYLRGDALEDVARGRLRQDDTPRAVQVLGEVRKTVAEIEDPHDHMALLANLATSYFEVGFNDMGLETVVAIKQPFWKVSPLFSAIDNCIAAQRKSLGLRHASTLAEIVRSLDDGDMKDETTAALSERMARLGDSKQAEILAGAVREPALALSTLKRVIILSLGDEACSFPIASVVDGIESLRKRMDELLWFSGRLRELGQRERSIQALLRALQLFEDAPHRIEPEQTMDYVMNISADLQGWGLYCDALRVIRLLETGSFKVEMLASLALSAEKHGERAVGVQAAAEALNEIEPFEHSIPDHLYSWCCLTAGVAAILAEIGEYDEARVVLLRLFEAIRSTDSAMAKVIFLVAVPKANYGLTRDISERAVAAQRTVVDQAFHDNRDLFGI